MSRRRILRHLLIAVCIVAVFSTALVQVLAVLLTVAAAWGWARNPQRKLHWSPLHTPFALFLLGRIISIGFSRDPSVSMQAFYIEYIFFLPFFVAAELSADDPLGTLRKLSHALVLAGTASAVIGCGMFFLGSAPRAQSTTAGPYTLGAFLCLALPFAVFAPKPGRGVQSAMAWLQVAMISLGIIVTLNRLHWVGMAATILAAAIILRRRLLLVPVLVAGLVILCIPAVQIRFLQLFHMGESMSGRDVLWNGAAMLWHQHPLIGFGPRTFREIFPLFDAMPVRGVGSWHNDYLQIYMESGLAGILPYLWLVGATAFHGWRAARASYGSRDAWHYTVAAYVALAVTFLVGGMLDTVVGIPVRILLGVFSQQIVALSRDPSSSDRVLMFAAGNV